MKVHQLLIKKNECLPWALLSFRYCPQCQYLDSFCSYCALQFDERQGEIQGRERVCGRNGEIFSMREKYRYAYIQIHRMGPGDISKCTDKYM